MSQKMHTSSSAASGSRQEPFGRSILNTLRKDGGFYVSALILLGYLFTTIQQITRYSYYGVELTYLLNIKIEDILLGILYVIVICLLPLLAYEGAKAPGSFSVTFLFLLGCSLFAYALTQRFPLNFIVLFSILLFAFHLIVSKCPKFIKKSKYGAVQLFLCAN